MASLTHVADYYNEDFTGTPATTLDVGSVVVNAGDTVIVGVKFEGGGSTTCAIAESGGGDPFTEEAVITQSSGEPNLCVGLLLSVTTGGTKTYRATLGASRTYIRMWVVVWRKGAGETVAKEAYSGTEGTATTLTSNNITTTDGAVAVTAFMAEYTTSTPTSFLINDSATGVTSVNAPTDADNYIWYSTPTTGFTNDASLTGYPAGNRWCCAVMAIKSTGGGGSTTTRQLTDNITLTDSDAQLMNLARQLSEAVAVSDGDAFYRTLQSQVSSLMEMVDSVAPQRFATRQLTELITLLDSASNGLGQIVTRALTDNISLSDAIARILTRAREDFTDVNDSSEMTRQRIRGLADTILLIDNIVDQHAIRNRVTTTNLILVDSLLRVALLTRALTDTAELSDSQTATYYAASSVALGYILHGFAQEGIVTGFEREQLH